MAEGPAAPRRAIAGPETRLSRSVHGMRYDEIHDEIVVTNPFAQALLTFRGGATGNEKPLRILQGPLTQLQYPSQGVDVDPVNDEVYVAESDRVLVFPRTANGDVGPIRILRGPRTQTRNWIRAISVDPANDLLVVTSDEDKFGPARILVFDRRAHGDVPPLRVIEGPATGIFKTVRYVKAYAPGGVLIATVGDDGWPPEGRPSGVAVWSIDDGGNVPPKWLLHTGRGRNSKFALNPEAKEVVIGGGVMVETFSFPEIF
jgi:hypothetical protein